MVFKKRKEIFFFSHTIFLILYSSHTLYRAVTVNLIFHVIYAQINLSAIIVNLVSGTSGGGLEYRFQLVTSDLPKGFDLFCIGHISFHQLCALRFLYLSPLYYFFLYLREGRGNAGKKADNVSTLSSVISFALIRSLSLIRTYKDI